LNNELVLCNLTVGDAGPVELIDAAAAGGFDSVNVWLSLAPGASDPVTARRPAADVVGDAALIRAIRERAEATGVGIFTASAGFISPSFDAARVAATLDTIAQLGGRSISVVGWDPEWERLRTNFALLCEAAAAASVAVHLEFMAYSTVKTLADAQRLISEAGAGNARVIIDTLHLDRSGGTPDDVARLAPETIASFQLSDARRAHPRPEQLRVESRQSRLYPGDGELPLRELIAVLPRTVAVELETPIAAEAHLPIDERARRAGAKARTFLSTPSAAR
jgi:sugar phosphate isomerase/epimerase